MHAKLAVASLAALAQESRLLIYRLLVEAGPTGLAVGEIGASVRVAPATLSFHLKELAHAGLVDARQDGRFIYYSANYGTMNRLLGYLTENCCARDGVGCETECCAGTASKTQSRNETPRRGRRAASKS
ncbi:MAG TPA: metalloregulator ArsR/SmtB family transcription factor [Usitatibacter sp.]|nr:metalloregulator ArsR/SmtB family transcription factor [Usitatibacter sp.]